MFSVIRKHRVFFAVAVALGVALRAVLIWKFRLVDGDSLIYGDIAKNWLTHGVFGVTNDGVPDPTYIRLPGYAGFLALIWRFAGLEHYTAALICQLVLDLGTCFVVADLARRVVSERAAKTAFLLCSLCPFIAIYVAAPLAETLSIFFTSLAIDFAIVATDKLASGKLACWVGCALATAAGILLRPDGGILLVAMGLFLLMQVVRPRGPGAPATFRRNAVVAGLLLAAVALAPLVPWTIRNWHQFHRFQPLAPRYANAPDEPVNEGYQRWIKTWIVDYISVVEVYWCIPGEQVAMSAFPARAFDSPQQRAATAAIFDEYNEQLHLSPELDNQLGQIARDRIQSKPFRYYVVLPALRIADMWFRPRTDLMRTNDRWWEYRTDPRGTFWALLMAGINLFLVGSAIFGVWRDHREIRYVSLLVLFVVTRSLFLGTLENPETRYTLECFPVIFVLAAAALTRRARKPENVLEFSKATNG